MYRPGNLFQRAAKSVHDGGVKSNQLTKLNRMILRPDAMANSWQIWNMNSVSILFYAKYSSVYLVKGPRAGDMCLIIFYEQIGKTV